jgi:hypothetical protein
VVPSGPVTSQYHETHITLSESFGHFDHPSGPCEALTTCEAQYDEAAHRLELRLDAALRTTDLRHKEQLFRPDWMPQSTTLQESVDLEEASDVARDVFHRWIRRVRESAPGATARD